MVRNLNRRRFLQTTTATVAAGFFSGVLPAADKKPSAHDRLQVGVIGLSNQGEYNWRSVEETGAAIVALCDVDEDRAGAARSHFPKATFDVDFRKMLDRRGLDAVVVATPDHTHAVATMAALKAGLHVYCEKPLTHDVHEARLVAQTTTKQKRVTQMGTQIHAGNNYRRVVELVQSGAVGLVREVHVWCNTSSSGGDRPKAEPVPAGLHWDLWLGPAPERPYSKAYHPFRWRGWWDFGGGGIADMGCHFGDLPFWALKLRHPTRVHAQGPPVHPESTAPWLIVQYEFPARGSLPAVRMTWYDGGKKPSLVKEGKVPAGDAGVLFIGDKGMLLADYLRHKLLPVEQYKGFVRPAPFIPESIGHHKEWVEACKTGGPTTCNFDYAGALTETVLLGIVSYRVGKPLEWDAKNLKATNALEAEPFLRREYRKPWTL